MKSKKVLDTVLIIKNIHKDGDIKKNFNECYQKYINFKEKRR